MKFNLSQNLIIVVALLFGKSTFAQAPSISYTTPQTYTAGTAISTLTPINTGGGVAAIGQTSTFAGSGAAGSANGTGTAATFYAPDAAAIDASGNIFLTDQGNNLIRKITPAGVVSTYAGTGSGGLTDGPVASARFYNPGGLVFDASGNLYVADLQDQVIRKITPSGIVSTFAGDGNASFANGTGTAANFNNPRFIAIDPSGNLYVTDAVNYMIRKITPAGVVSTFAGSGTMGSADGSATTASFTNLRGIVADPSGNLFAVDNNEIRKITPAGVVSTFAGSTTIGSTNGTGTAATFAAAVGIAIDSQGNLYVSESGNNMIRKITPAAVVTTIAGTSATGSTDGPGTSATFNNPAGMAVDASGFLYVTDYNSNLIRKVLTLPYTISPALPAGLSFNNTTGTVTGTPTAASPSTAYTITAYNSAGTSTTTLNITVNAPGAIQPSNDQNYIITYTPRVAGFTNPGAVIASSADKNSIETSIQYSDGLGRPLQTVQAGGSPLGYDLVQATAYDAYEREAVKYLPYAPQSGLTGSYRPNAVTTDQNAFYTTPPTGSGVSANANPNSQTNFEPSPLNRTVEQGAPGAAWQLSTSGVSGSGHTVKMSYTLNNSIPMVGTGADTVNSRRVARYDVTINSTTQARALVANGYYPAGTLTVTISKDENWADHRAGTTEEYKDMEGHVLLKRQYNYAGSLQVLSTYYVYDDMGLLAFVLPPGSLADNASTVAQATLDNQCYQYRYDERGRLTQKKIPGKAWEYTVYNAIDQPVATQDSLQRANKNWIVTKYDAMGRPALTYIWDNGATSITRTALQSTLSGITTNLWEAPIATGNGYTNVAWPTATVTATLTTNYYDGYTAMPGLPGTYTLTSGISTMTRGLTTAKLTAVLNTPADQLWDVSYYDDLGRSITSYAQHYLGGTVNTGNYDLINTTYNFTNAPTTVTRQHWNTGSTAAPLVTVVNTYLYDHMGRKLKTWEQITNGSNTPTTKTLISKMDYNEIGQVKGKHLHSTVDSVNSTGFLQNITYTYNERGWLRTSSSLLFNMRLDYNTNTNKFYNGNIAYQFWGPTLSNYAFYLYDKLNRLNAGATGANNNESAISYDLRGNIIIMHRSQAGTLIDNLAYSYNNTNQLQSITDATSSDIGVKHGTSTFTYDANGNLTSDPSKPTGTVNFTYNLLNLPQTVTGAKTITYTYDATGNKLRRVSTATGNTDYISGIQYDGTTTSSLSFIQTEEGKAVPSGANNYNYVYYLGDNLGNTRVTFDTGTGSAAVIQTDDYYAFGMEIPGSATGTKNEYLYNKKELQEELQEYDYGARFYDPVIGRWDVIDELADHSDQIDKSPYTYVWDDPIGKNDPDGKCPSCLIGALVGAGLEYTVEVATNVIHDGHFSTGAFTNVSAKKILLAGAAGAFGGGIASGAAKLGSITADLVASNLGKTVIKEGIAIVGDATSSVIGSKIQGNKITANSVLSDVTGGVIGRQIAGKVSAVAKDSPEGRQLARNAKRAANVAVGSRPTRVAAAKVAANEAENFGATKAAFAGAVGSNSASKILQAIYPDKPKKHN